MVTWTLRLWSANSSPCAQACCTPLTSGPAPARARRQRLCLPRHLEGVGPRHVQALWPRLLGRHRVRLQVAGLLRWCALIITCCWARSLARACRGVLQPLRGWRPATWAVAGLGLPHVPPSPERPPPLSAAPLQAPSAPARTRPLLSTRCSVAPRRRAAERRLVGSSHTAAIQQSYPIY